MLRDRATDSLVRRFVAGATWSTAGAFFSRALNLASTVVLARILGKTVFGEFGLVESTVGTFAVFAGFGLGNTVTRTVAINRERDPLRARRALAAAARATGLSGALSGLALAGGASLLAGRVLAAPQLAGPLAIAGLLVMLGAISTTQRGGLAAFEAYSSLAVINVLASGLGFVGVTAGAWLGGLAGALLGSAAGLLAGVAANEYALRRTIRLARLPAGTSTTRDDYRIVGRLGLPSVVATLLVFPVTWGLQAWLARQPDGYQAIAELTVASSWRGLVMQVPALLLVSYLPVASSLAGAASHLSRRLMLANALLAAVVTGVLAVVVAIASPWLLTVYGPTFVSGRAVLALMLGVAVFDSANSVLLQTLIASDRAWWRVVSNTVWCVVAVGAAIPLIPALGAVGMALALLLAQAVHLAVQLPLALNAVKSGVRTAASRPQATIENGV